MNILRHKKELVLKIDRNVNKIILHGKQNESSCVVPKGQKQKTQEITLKEEQKQEPMFEIY